MGTAPGARLCPAGAGCVHGRLRTAAPASRRPRGWAGCHRASRGHTGRGPCASRASPRPARGVLREPRCGGRAAGSNHGTAPASDQTPDRSAERTAAPVGQAGPPALPRGVSFTWHLFVHSAMSHRGLLRAEHTSNARTISGPTPVTAESVPGLAALARASPAGRSPESARGFPPCWQGLQASELNGLTCLMDPGAGAPQNHGPQVPCHTGGLMSDPASAGKLGTAAAVRSRSSVGFPGSLLPSRATRTCQSDTREGPFRFTKLEDSKSPHRKLCQASASCVAPAPATAAHATPCPHTGLAGGAPGGDES